MGGSIIVLQQWLHASKSTSGRRIRSIPFPEDHRSHGEARFQIIAGLLVGLIFLFLSFASSHPILWNLFSAIGSEDIFDFLLMLFLILETCTDFQLLKQRNCEEEEGKKKELSLFSFSFCSSTRLFFLFLPSFPPHIC